MRTVLTDDEWRQLSPLLAAASDDNDARRGRPRLDNDRRAAEACVFRHYHGLSPIYGTFGWNELPADIGISPSTANRRFREWSADGRWQRFWQALLELRRETRPAQRRKLSRRRAAVQPVQEILDELDRAYHFFNDYLFAGELPGVVAISLERTDLSRRNRGCGGYYCGRLWRRDGQRVGHIAVCTLALGQGPEPALATLLHEMVHLRNDQLRLRDCHPGNQYHSRTFRDVAHLSGLVCPERHPRLGYAHTILSPVGHRALRQLRPAPRPFAWSVGEP